MFTLRLRLLDSKTTWFPMNLAAVGPVLSSLETWFFFLSQISFFSWAYIQFDSSAITFVCLSSGLFLSFQASSKLPASCNTCNTWCWFCPSNVYVILFQPIPVSRKCIRKSCAHIFVRSREVCSSHDSSSLALVHTSHVSKILCRHLFLLFSYTFVSTSYASCHPDFFFPPPPFTLFFSWRRQSWVMPFLPCY